MVKNYHKNKGKPSCAIKIDIMKAFDSVNWRFVLNVLRAMGFPSKFISWVQACITSPFFSVKINGISEGYFPAKKGLRQDDPLSPYLFAICMEIFSRLMDSAACAGLVGFHPQCSKVSLTHLCFADDLLVFSEAFVESLSGVKQTLERFYELSGLRVSFPKSEIFFCAVPSSDQETLAAQLGVKIGFLSVRYLGVPLISGKLRAQDCAPLVEKITARVHQWATRFLSYAGRLQLIHSVLTSMYNYWCSIFILPKKVIKDVERICNAFLWKGKEEVAIGANVSWSTICKPKMEGGLGLKRVLDWNIACIARILWLRYCGKDSLWIAWIKLNVLKGKCFWQIRENPSHSWWWKKLLKLRPTFRTIFTFKVGNGDNICLWHDAWHPLGPLLDALGPDAAYLSGIPLESKLSKVIQDQSWRWPAARTMTMHMIQSSLPFINPGADSIWWVPSKNGLYHTGATWSWLHGSNPHVSWHKIIWFKGMVPRWAFITWLALQNFVHVLKQMSILTKSN